MLVVEDNSEKTLLETIQKELKDENSHPRVRKGIHEKFYLAIKRINDSSLPEDIQSQLIAIHIKIMEELI